jgi:N-methylhydantoinase A
LLELARGNRPDHFNPLYTKPTCFIERYLRREVPGTVSSQGEIMVPLDLTDLESILNDFKNEGVEAIAVCLIGSYANPI